MSLERRAYRFRMEPTGSQRDALMFLAGARRFVYNWALERRRTHYEEHARGISKKQLSGELTALKNEPDTSWLKLADSQSLQQALRDLDGAFEAFFAHRARYPRYRSKKHDPATFRIPQRVKLVEGSVYVPKVGWVRIRQSQPISGTIKGATFKQTPACHWFVTLTVEFDLPDTPLPAVNPTRVVGVDAGLENLITQDNGRKVAAPQHLRKTEKRLARAQRALSRKKKGSNNRGKARVRVARLHEKIRNQRVDHLHKLTTHLIRNADGSALRICHSKALREPSWPRASMTRHSVSSAGNWSTRQGGTGSTWW